MTKNVTERNQPWDAGKEAAEAVGKSRWDQIIEEIAAKGGNIDRAIAERILGDLIGYSKRSSKKDVDAATLAAAMIAFHHALDRRGL